jgi:hypothetical protein
MKNVLLKILLLVVSYIGLAAFALAFMLMYANPLTLIITAPVVYGVAKLCKVIYDKLGYSNSKKWSS